MSFRRAGLKAIGGKGQAYGDGKILYYINTSDTLATMLASGYFNDISNNLDANYTVFLTGSDGETVAKLVRDSTGLILTALSDNLPVGAGSTLTLSKALHHNKIILLDQADGSVITLPAATGSGLKVELIVSVTVTSNVHSIATDSDSDEFLGHVYQVDTDTSDAIAAYPAVVADNFDLISMNGTTTGGLIGDRIKLLDLITGVWAIDMLTNGNGTVASPIA